MNDLFSSIEKGSNQHSALALPGSASYAEPRESTLEGEPRDEAWRQEKISRITAGLNPPQLEAVTHETNPLLVMAGAGSGKTRVLTRRIAWLLATDRVLPWEVLSITFTNKAAAEMRERISALVGAAAKYMWISTFHSACVRILRNEAEALGRSKSFSIYDTGDSKALLTRIVKGRNLDPKRFTPKSFAVRISNAKSELITPSQYLEATGPGQMNELTAEIYAEYQQLLHRANAFDFDDLINEVVYLWRDHQEILEKYRRRFRQVLIDEYQDTNPAQYALVRELTRDDGPGAPAQLTVVGDSDQSIYAFRGATIRNIEEFESDFPGAKTIYLEQNYRSTSTILEIANAIISENQGRHKKHLWTDAGAGSAAVLYAADSDRDEAAFVVREISSRHAAGARWDNFAVFYRTNAQSRVIEEALRGANIPYRVVGGTKFYDRKEIKDAIAYLTAAINPADETNTVRALSEPKRGIGAAALRQIRALAREAGITFGAALREFLPGKASGGKLNAKATAGLKGFVELLETVREMDSAGAPIDEILSAVLEMSGYLDKLRASNDPQDDARIENLTELHAAAEEFSLSEPDSRLADFLERISLVSDTEQLPDAEDIQAESEAQEAAEVTLMTVHTAKGLEFNTVFVTGLEDGLFPHTRSLDDPEALAEERRLAYVAVTRARKQLYLTRSASRMVFGDSVNMPASRFLDALPDDVVDNRRETTTLEYYSTLASRKYRESTPRFAAKHNRGTSGAAKGGKQQFTNSSVSITTARQLGADHAPKHTRTAPSRDIPDLHVGQRVRHDIYGTGKVIGLEGEGVNTIAKVKFPTSTKRLMLKFAPLSVE